MSFSQKVATRNQTFMFHHLLTLNQNVICNILCALNWVCVCQDKNKQIYEVNSTLFITFLTNYAGNMLSTRIITKKWKKLQMTVKLLAWSQEEIRIRVTFNKNQRTHIILPPDIVELSFVFNNISLHSCVWLSTADQQ